MAAMHRFASYAPQPKPEIPSDRHKWKKMLKSLQKGSKKEKKVEVLPFIKEATLSMKDHPEVKILHEVSSVEGLPPQTNPDDPCTIEVKPLIELQSILPPVPDLVY